ncbi:hypothetical protein ABPG72_014880 [Tetrahymena utriculariae]
MSSQSSQLKDFDIIKTLGEGSFAKVYKVVRKSDGQSYAMKKCKIGLMKQRDKENALNEVHILASIKNQYVIAYKEAIYDEQSECLFVIMEYAAGGDLQQQVKNCIKSKTCLDENQIWIWTIQMLYGLKALHDLKILHRDLKCANIFLDSRRNAKIGDLNVSKITQANLARTQVGTPYYTSPEVWKDQMYNNKSDIWSLGCLIYELCAQKPPFLASDMPSLFKKIGKGIYERIPSRYSSELSNLISQCLNINQTTRPDCDQLLNLPIIKKKIEDLNIKQDVFSKEDFNAQAIIKKVSVLDQIKYPVNKKNLQERLPKPSYNTNSQQEIKKVTPNNQIGTYQTPTSEELKNMRRVRSNSGIQLKSQNPQPQQYQRFDFMLEQEIQRRLSNLNSRDYLSQQSQQNIPSSSNLDLRKRKISEDIQNYQYKQLFQDSHYNLNYISKPVLQERKRSDRYSYYERNRDQENNIQYSNRIIPHREIYSAKNPFSGDPKNVNQYIKKPYSIRNDIPLPYSSLNSNKEAIYFGGAKRVQTEVRSLLSKQYR